MEAISTNGVSVFMVGLAAVGALAVVTSSAAQGRRAAASSPGTAERKCPRGSVDGVINGRHKCLKKGQRCAARFDRQYRRYGFRCRNGKLVPLPPKKPPEPSPPPGFEFDSPVSLGPSINGPTFDGGPSISANGLVLYFTSDNRPGGLGHADIWITTRATTADAFGPPTNVGPPINGSSSDVAGEVSADNLTFYFASDRPGAFGAFCNLWAVTRASPAEAFGRATDLGPAVNLATCNDHPTISGDGLTLVFSSDGSAGPGDHDLFISTRTTTSAPFGPARNLGPMVNGSGSDSEPSISADGLTLYFASYRLGGIGDKDIWVTTRPTVSAEFGAPMNLGRPVNSRYEDGTPDISSDGSTLFFHSFRPGGPGGGDLWSARKKS